ncbi:NLI interacting factor-like phosphatase [Carpediemonas membranifera]|uniref:NLI interacting factor-like phosphatase n=1 Tax=Carpediemonas membranifera TaxID=201153 RepID=A0A8J6ARG4_9EUKA|nr:NLI interacting factor-like phosphatase [Carpediemonas membranifera]|eukprot:KAG9392416.1 NLI interacting factor-like phosphatase [Carpediemonas membranifera]
MDGTFLEDDDLDVLDLSDDLDISNRVLDDNSTDITPMPACMPMPVDQLVLTPIIPPIVDPDTSTGESSSSSLTTRPKQLSTSTSKSRDSLGQLEPLFPFPPGRKCLVLDLDETLIQGSYENKKKADIVSHVLNEGTTTTVYAMKRPGLDDFLFNMARHYTLVLFTASKAEYADPILDKLDVHRVLTRRLYRESCTNSISGLTKDITMLARGGLTMRDVVLLDNSQYCTRRFEQNSLLVDSWYGDQADTALYDITPFLIQLSWAADVRVHLGRF